MNTVTQTRELQQIAKLMASRGLSAVIDGDAVAVLCPRQHSSEGLAHVRYEVRRLWTVTQAYLALH
jgi:hypothetical protein